MKNAYENPEILVKELFIADTTNEGGYDDASGNVTQVPGLYNLVEEE